MPRPENDPDQRPRPFAPASPTVIGLVGGIASGKSTVAALFASHGVKHIDADRHAREASRDPDVLTEIRSRIGERYVVDDQIDREAMADLVFNDASAKDALESIIHPRVRARILADVRRAADQGQSSLLDVPLLFEAGLWALCDRIVFVEASCESREARAQTRGWDADELARREQSQLPLAEKQSRSDATINNEGPIHETAKAVADLLRGLEAGG